jgi:hypothetical protein
MPEVPLCLHCKKPIDKQNEDYVVLNKDQVKYEDKWVYAHADCARNKN